MARGLILRLAASVAVGLAVGGAILLVQRVGGAEEGPRLEQPVTVRAGVSSPVVLFGDTLRLDVDVLVDSRRVDPASVRLVGGFAPFTERSRTIERSRSGDAESVSFRVELACVERGCLPQQGRPRPVRLERGFVLYGSGGRAALDWPGVEVTSRLAAADRVRPALRLSDAPPPPPSWSASPSLVAGLLFGAAALLGLAGLALLAVEARRLLARRGGDPLAGLPPVERALALLRRARTPAERRTALDRLARALDGDAANGDGLAAEARSLAWSERTPAEPDAAELADRAARR